MRSIRHNEQGHVEVGVTLAIIIVMGLVGWMAFSSGGKPFALWLSWPWWAKGLSIIGPIAVLLIGGKFESSRQWPKM